MLLIVRTPTTAAVRSVSTTKSTVLSKVVLVATGTLVSQSTEAAILVTLAEMAGIAAKTLLLRETTLAALALRVVGSRSWTSGLGSKSRRTRSTALAVAERLQ